MSKIRRDLPNDEYQAAVGANNASAANVFATIDDLTAAVTGDANRIVFDVKIDQVGGILKGQAVYVSGADGTNILVSKADYSVEATSATTLGLMITDGNNNAQRQVVAEGILKGTGAAPLDTSTASPGDPIWLGDDGNLIYGAANEPYAPNQLVFIGVVVEANPVVGEIFVKVQNGYELGELHDVDVKSVVPTNEQVLTYESSTQLWKNKDLPSVIGGTIDVNLSPVLDNTLTSPPFNQAFPDDSYIVASPATGLWTGQENNIATWDGENWLFYTPVLNDITTVLTGINAGNVYKFDGINWNITTSTSPGVTPFFLAGSGVDAGANKTGTIARTGRVVVGRNQGAYGNAAFQAVGTAISDNFNTRYGLAANFTASNLWSRLCSITLPGGGQKNFQIFFNEVSRDGNYFISAVIHLSFAKVPTVSSFGKGRVRVVNISQESNITPASNPNYKLDENNFVVRRYSNVATAGGGSIFRIYYRPTVPNTSVSVTVLNGKDAGAGLGVTGIAWEDVRMATIETVVGGGSADNLATFNYSGQRTNISAVVDPTVNDDVTFQYSIGSLWYNTVTQKVFQCLDNSGSAAVWKQITNEAASAGSPYLNNVVLVNSVSDLPAPSGGTITLAANTVYEFNTGSFNIGTNYLTISDGTIIEGQSSFNTTLIYTGTGGAIRGTDVSFAARQIAFASPAGRVLDVTNVAQTKNLSFQNCVFSSQTSASVVTGYNIVFMAQTRFVSCAGGINLVNNLGVAFELVVFNTTNSGTYITLTPTAATTAKFQNCDLEINTGNTGINITSTAIASGIISGCDFKGTATVANRLVGVNGNTTGWNIAYGANTGIAGLQLIDIEISTTVNTALGNAAGTYLDTGVKSYALPITSYDAFATVMEGRITALMTNAVAVQSGVYDVTTAAIVGGLGTGVSGTNVAVPSNFIAITPNREYTGYYVKPTGASTRLSLKLTLKIY